MSATLEEPGATPYPAEMQRAEATATILVIEDHESLRNIANFVLEKAGFTVLTAENGPEAVEMLKNKAVDLVLTDIQLPGGMSGLDIAETVATTQGPIPTIFMSGLRAKLPRGANYHFLPKPFRPVELVNLVNHALHMRFHQDQGA